MSLPIQITVLRPEVLYNPKNVPNSFIYPRFEGVEALEGSEKAPAIFTIFFSGYNCAIIFWIFARHGTAARTRACNLNLLAAQIAQYDSGAG